MSDAAGAPFAGPPSTALAAFLQATELEPEHRRLMDEHHRPIDWAASTATTLPAALRAGLAELWRTRATSEHRSIGIFNLYALDLLGAGAPVEMLSLACRAALDEVRHTELFCRLASLYSGAPESPPPGIPPMPDDPEIPIRLQVAREALHLSVVSESYSCALLSQLHERARDPAVKGALAAVLADEIHHARMGWSLLSLLLERDGDGALRAYLQADLEPALEQFVRDLFDDPKSLPAASLQGDERALAEQHGYSAIRDEYALFHACVRDVWIPGLTGLGLDAASLVDKFPPPVWD
ncbi:MAG: hypothetical protein U0271_06155 [Polyangiaceae bacterium]